MIVKNTSGRYPILYDDVNDIDGFRCRDQFVQLIQSNASKPQYNRAHEWCCGTGAIGFKILEQALCKHLVLSDIYQPAVLGCEYTVALNDLSDCVTMYVNSDIKDLPQHERWDLVVANPPWRSEFRPGPAISQSLMRKMFDINWHAHQCFYSSIGGFLDRQADVWIYEDQRFSSPDTWQSWFRHAGLVLHEVHGNFGGHDTGYVMHLKSK